MNNISDIKHAFYINLDSRPDRKEFVETQLKTIGIEATRFNAIKLKNGAIGCSMSHLKCLEIAKANKWPHVLIVEDDINFLNPELFVTQLNKFLFNHKNFDVILIAGNNIPPYKTIDDTCVQVTRCQTTTGYLVNGHYIDILINNYKTGIQNLMREPANHFEYAIDKYWFNLQQTGKWYLIIPLTVTQRADYSDIEKGQTNYAHLMLDLDKKSFFKASQLRQTQTASQNIKMNLFN
jgi:GR25 family glycosyltransferase involved in LPS biosynthesis